MIVIPTGLHIQINNFRLWRIREKVIAFLRLTHYSVIAFFI
ncbi:hypothetical protein BGP_5866 [Beggiatoa sp. PS]|nr:hypothetical protein BGP_5866 [Beggiatoa sp. PS]